MSRAENHRCKDKNLKKQDKEDTFLKFLIKIGKKPNHNSKMSITD